MVGIILICLSEDYMLSQSSVEIYVLVHHKDLNSKGMKALHFSSL